VKMKILQEWIEDVIGKTEYLMSLNGTSYVETRKVRDSRMIKG
jgi:hypothetical protein